MSNTNDYHSQAQNQPPRPATTDTTLQVFSAATAIAATSSDIWVGYPLDAGGLRTPQGKCWIELEAVGFPVYVRFCQTALVGTTANNGTVIPVAGARPVRFYVDPTKDLFLDHISPGGVGVLKWRRVGAIAERSRT